MCWLGEGLDNATIACRLFLSELTVKSYLTNLFTKLGVNNRLQAVIHAYETGVLTPRRRTTPFLDSNEAR